jgi:hypothetical protein
MTFFGTPGVITQGVSDTKLFAPKAYGEILIERKNKKEKIKEEVSF